MNSTLKEQHYQVTGDLETIMRQIRREKRTGTLQIAVSDGGFCTPVTWIEKRKNGTKEASTTQKQPQTETIARFGKTS